MSWIDFTESAWARAFTAAIGLESCEWFLSSTSIREARHEVQALIDAAIKLTWQTGS